MNVQSAVAGCLSDHSLEVQSLATRLVGLLAVYSGRNMLQLTLGAHCPDHIKAMALKSIFGAADLSELQSIVTSYLGGNPSVFATPEGIDALFVYASRSPYKADLVSTFLNLLDGGSSARVYEALALVLPAAKNSDWSTKILPKLGAQKDSPLLFGLIANLAPHQELHQFLVTLTARCVKAAKLHTESENCEYALNTLAVLVKEVPQTHELARQLVDVANEALQFHEYGFAVEEEEEEEEEAEQLNLQENDEDEDVYSDYDSSFVDESSGVRQGGASLARELISVYGISNLTQALVTAAQRETNTLTKSLLYTALQVNDNPVIAELEPTVARDVRESKDKAVYAGISMFASVPAFHDQILRLSRATISKYPKLVSLFLTGVESFLQSTSTPNTVEFSSKDLEIVEYIIGSSLSTGSEPHGSYSSVFQGLQLIVELKLIKLVGPVTCLLKPAQPVTVRAAALNTLQKLSAQIESLQPSRWNDIVDAVLPLMQNAPGLRVSALKLLNNIFTSASSISAEAAERIVFSISEILQVEPSPDAIDACIEVLRSAPPSVGPYVARAVVSVHVSQTTGKQLVDALEKVLLNFTDNLGDEKKDVSQWAVQNHALQLLAAIPVGDLGPEVSPEVRTAALLPDLSALDSHFHFSTTPFADLSQDQQRALLTVLKYAKQSWYNDFIVHDELQADIFGTFLAGQDPEEILSVPESAAVDKQYVSRVFTALCTKAARYQHLSFFITIMKKSSQLRSPSGISQTIKNPADVKEFIESFLTTEPEFLVSTLKLLPLPLLDNELEAFKFIFLNSSLEAGLRVDALDTMRWALVQRERYAELREAVLPLLTPDPTKVSVINIGPFKHRVDSTLPLRLEAMESLLTTARRSSADAQTVELIVKYSLHDDPAIKLLAYRLLSVWGESNVVRSQREAIDVAISQLKAPKESAGKVEHERFQELQRAVQDTQLRISKVSK